MPKKAILLVFGLLVLILLVIIYAFFLQSNKVNIQDAYCDNNGHFNFTLVNGDSSDMNLTYKWHLDDPKSDTPRPISENGHFTDNYYIGYGNITVPGNSNITIVIPIRDDPNYPMMNLVMDIELFKGNKSIYHYREQKYGGYWDTTQNKTINGSWDYSTLPPKRR